MEEQQRFLEAMEDIKRIAKSGNHEITKKQIDNILRGIELSKEQLQLVYGYLKNNHISIAGIELKNNSYEKMNTEHIENRNEAVDKSAQQDQQEEEERDRKIIAMYTKDLNTLENTEHTTLDEEKVIEKIIAGDKKAENRLIESYLHRIIEWVHPLKGRGIAESDLIQEANLVLLLFIDEIKRKKIKIKDFEQELSKRIKKVCDEMLNEQGEIALENEHLVNKINAVNDCASTLAESLGRKVTVDEVAKKLGISVSEVKETAELSLRKIEDIII